MGNWDLGSCANTIQNIIPNVPSAVSGTQLLDIVDRRRLYMEDYTGLTIGSTGILAKYQPALTNLAISDVLRLIHLQGGDTSIGDVRLGNSALTSAEYYERQGIKELQRLGMKTTIGKTFG